MKSYLFRDISKDLSGQTKLKSAIQMLRRYEIYLYIDFEKNIKSRIIRMMSCFLNLNSV